MGHAELQELLGAYALDAVDPDEAAAIEAHLPICPRCRTELTEHREVAALLGYAGGSAPSGLWDRIIASLEEPPPALRLTRASLPDLPPEVPHTPAPIHARPFPPVASASQGNVVPITRPGRARTMETRAFVAVATAAAVIVAILGIAVGRLETRRPSTQTANLATLAYHVADADSTARHLTLASPDGVHTIRAVIIADGTTYLGPGNLAQLPSDETYQMWGIVNGARVSLGVIGDNPSYHVFTTPSVANVIAMTVEQKGGVVSSTKAPVVAGVVPA